MISYKTQQKIKYYKIKLILSEAYGHCDGYTTEDYKRKIKELESLIVEKSLENDLTKKIEL